MTTSDLASEDRVDFQVRRGKILAVPVRTDPGNLTTATCTLVKCDRAGSSSVMVCE
jgi:hypothetical protein